LREELESGRLAWEEYSHYGMISRLQAGASGLSFFPMNSTAAGDLERSNPQYRRITDPYSGREVVTVPALNPDVAIVHVQRADKNEILTLGDHREQKKLPLPPAMSIITRRKSWMRKHPLRSEPHDHSRVHRSMRSAMCPTAAPFLHPGYYDRDNAFYLNWDKVTGPVNQPGLAGRMGVWARTAR